MAREVITTVNLWDDLDAANGEKTEAAETVLLQLGDIKVTLDLTEAHAAELAELLAPWLAAGSPVIATPAVPARRSAGTNGGNGNGNAVNGAEQAAYRAALRQWADAQGRTSEYKVARADGNGTTYIYPVALRNDFDAFQAAAQAAAKPEVPAEPEAKAEAPEPEVPAEPEAPKAPVTPIARGSRRPAK